MRKIVFICLLAFFVSFILNAENTNSKEEVSILYPGVNISFDVTKASLHFSCNNYRYTDKSGKMIWGISAIAKNQKGISELLKNGTLTPGSKISLTIGKLLKNRTEFHDSEAEEELRDLIKKINKHNKIKKGYQSMWRSLVWLKELKKAIVNKDQIKIYTFVSDIEKTNYFTRKVRIEIKRILSNMVNNKIEALEKLIQNIEVELVGKSKKAKEAVQLMRALYPKLNSLYEKEVFKTNILYLTVGAISQSFKMFKPEDGVAFSESFKKKNFQGVSIKVGYSSVSGKTAFGFNIGVERADTLGFLVNKDYMLETVKQNGDEYLKETKELNAYYEGKYLYEKYYQLAFNMDFVKTIAFSSKHKILWSPVYLRGVLPFKEDPMIPQLSLGTDIQLLTKDHKPVGGIYLQYLISKKTDQYPSVLNFNRVRFGIIAKIPVSSIFK